LDAAGWSTVIIETVGVGQSEVDIAATADTTVVVTTPGWGDEVQASKAGVLEVVDIFVVNKSDRPGATATASDLERMVHLGAPRPWTPSVVQSIATTEGGAHPLAQAISAHRSFLLASSELTRRRTGRRVGEALNRARDQLSAAFDDVCNSAEGRRTLADVEGGGDPVWASARLIELLVGAHDPAHVSNPTR
jgi:LAO/AO transport system kinase